MAATIARGMTMGGTIQPRMNATPLMAGALCLSVGVCREAADAINVTTFGALARSLEDLRISWIVRYRKGRSTSAKAKDKAQTPTCRTLAYR